MSNTPSLRQRFLDLQEGQEMNVSLEDYAMTTVKSYASDISFTTGRKFICRRNRQTKSYTVTRTA